jgi:tetratricopeptide (TPR) repeat protein
MEEKDKRKEETSGSKSSRLQKIRHAIAKRLALLALVMLVVFIGILGYNYYLQNQLSTLRKEAITIDNRLKQLELNQTKDPSLRELAEKLEFVMSQQQTSIAATQEMIDYMTFTFTLIGVFFLLVSGYFVYRQQRSEQREDEGWVLAKDLLDLVTQSQSFVVRVQEDLRAQQNLQEQRRQQTKSYIEATASFLNHRATVLVTQFARDTISQGINFTRLVDISNRIDSLRFQLQTYEIDFDPNCYFLKAVYEYIIGNYNAAKDEFENLIKKRAGKVLDDTEKKQLSLCYYYSGLIEYNVQENLDKAIEHINAAVDKDPQINGPDFKSLLLRAEINFKLKNAVAFEQYEQIIDRLARISHLSDTQKRLQSYAYLGMAYCKILQGGLKFLPAYYKDICRLPEETFQNVIGWLNLSKDSHVYTSLTLGQLAIIFEQHDRKAGLKTSREYFAEALEWLNKERPHVEKEETRAKILAYSVKLVCEKCLNESIELSKFVLRDLLNDRELKAIYSIFSKVNVSKNEYLEELRQFGVNITTS